MRRESNLYSFDELWTHTEDASEEENYPKKYYNEKNKNAVHGGGKWSQ